MASKSEVNEQLDRLHAVFIPLHPAQVNGKPNERHVAMRNEYIRCLEGFTSHELVMGFDDLLASWKYQKWPSPAECASACRHYHKSDHVKALPHYEARGEAEELPLHHRLIMARGYRNYINWIKSGEIQHKTRDDGLREPCRDAALERQIRDTNAEEKFSR